LTLFSRLAGVSKTVLDAGGNIGIYGCIGAAQLPPGGRLVTFEPVPQNLAYVRRNLDQNGLTDRVEVVQTALGPQQGTVVIHLAAAGFTGSHSVAQATVGSESTGSMTVPMTTIDDYVREHGLSPVDLVKVDVEGFDIAVLRGALRTLRADKPTLMVEYAPALLRNAGYDPIDLLEIVFSNYEHVMLIDEPRNVVRATDRAELAAMANRKNLVNLVAISRPDHLTLCREPL
jgi:FkbM family methyltransferase